MKEMTKMGVENLLNRIEKHMIVLPKDTLTVKELEMWLKGYSQCQFTIMEIVREMMEEQNG